jgi:hypothetical protein
MSDEQLTFESFADYPSSVQEKRAIEGRDARQWTPRDALINILRDIDQGKLNPYAMVIHWKTAVDGGPGYRVGFAVAGAYKHELLGMNAEFARDLLGEDLA